MLISNSQMLGACISLLVLCPPPTIHLFALKYYDTGTVCVCVCVCVSRRVCVVDVTSVKFAINESIW
jgi:hypothetical protein